MAAWARNRLVPQYEDPSVVRRESKELHAVSGLEQTPDRLEPLVRLFYDAITAVGNFSTVADSEMPAAYRQLLAHEHHMTVTVEKFHGGPVDVQVLDKVVGKEHYARKILLTRRSDEHVVQFGIMRVHLWHLPADVCEEIVNEQTPLGRILIEHDVMRKIHLHRLWRVEPGSGLQHHFGVDHSNVTYGRTATIECNGEPAIELLEIVAPLPTT